MWTALGFAETGFRNLIFICVCVISNYASERPPASGGTLTADGVA
jgi:hypothetical protein